MEKLRHQLPPAAERQSSPAAAAGAGGFRITGNAAAVRFSDGLGATIALTVPPYYKAEYAYKATNVDQNRPVPRRPQKDDQQTGQSNCDRHRDENLGSEEWTVERHVVLTPPNAKAHLPRRQVQVEPG